MTYTKTNTFYKSSENHLNNIETLKVPKSVFRQELVTWQHTDSGIKKTTVVRTFANNIHIDSFTSEPFIHEK